MKTLFISFEGVDGSGKSTQVKLLNEWLNKNNLKSVTTHDPGGTVCGEQIRALIKNPQMEGVADNAELMLFSASRAQLCEEVIVPNIKKGVFVISDRFIDSTFAYQCHARNISVKTVKKAVDLATGGLKPDITFFINLTPKQAFERKGGSDVGNRSEGFGLEFFNKVYAGFKAQARKHPRRIKVIDGTKSIEEMHTQVIKELKKKYAEFSGFN